MSTGDMIREAGLPPGPRGRILQRLADIFGLADNASRVYFV